VELDGREGLVVDRRLRFAEEAKRAEGVGFDRLGEGHRLDDVDDLGVAAVGTVAFGVRGAVILVSVVVIIMTVFVGVAVGMVVISMAVRVVMTVGVFVVGTVRVVVIVGVRMLVIDSVSIVDQQHVNGRRRNPVFDCRVDCIPDRKGVFDRIERRAVGTGGEERAEDHIAAGTQSTVEGECSHGIPLSETVKKLARCRSVRSGQATESPADGDLAAVSRRVTAHRSRGRIYTLHNW